MAAKGLESVNVCPELSMNNVFIFLEFTDHPHFMSVCLCYVLLKQYDANLATGRITNESSHYTDVKMGPMVSQITSLAIVYSNVYSGADLSKHQSSASLAFVWGIHRVPVNSLHKWPVTQEMFSFDGIINDTME